MRHSYLQLTFHFQGRREQTEYSVTTYPICLLTSYSLAQITLLSIYLIYPVLLQGVVASVVGTLLPRLGFDLLSSLKWVVFLHGSYSKRSELRPGVW